MGAGGNTELIQQNVGADTFSFTGYTSGRGIRFKDLRITYITPVIAPPQNGAAISTNDCQNVTCERVYFNNCPQAVYFDNRSQECGLLNCTIYYDNQPIPGAVMVYLGGSYNFIDDCLLSQASQSSPGGGPLNCTGIVVQPDGGLSCITNTHISDFTTGILVQGNTNSNLTRLFASNVVCESWMNAVIIQPPSNTGRIYDVFFGDCLFEQAQGSTELGAVGVYIDTNGGANGHVANIFLNNCLCYGWTGPAVQINAGQDIVITGGRYGSSATGEGSADSGGIAITGTPADVTITGADLTPQVPTFSVQPHAISITAEVQGLYVRGCDLSGYASNSPLFTSGAGTQIEITNCAGYNDQGTILQETVPPTSATLANTYSWTNAPNGWFGPITFYVMGTGNVSIGNATTSPVNTHLSSGGFTLSSGQIATIAAGAATFLAIGQ
jgi:hypothetical protein